MYEDGDKCPVCDTGTLTKKIIEKAFDYKGETLTIKDYIIYECHVCEELIVDRKILEDTEGSLIEFRRKVDKLLTPNKIRKIRTSFGYTQEEFGNILGGGKKAFARYENGVVTQSRAMDNQLKMLRSNPEILAVIVKKLPDIIKASHEIDASATEGSYLGSHPNSQSFFTDVTKGEDNVIRFPVSTVQQTQAQLITATA